MFFYLEEQETDKLKLILVFIQAKEDHILPQELDHKVENSKELEEEDDLLSKYLNILNSFLFKFIIYYF
jgi:hypothetical protein